MGSIRSEGTCCGDDVLSQQSMNNDVQYVLLYTMFRGAERCGKARCDGLKPYCGV